MKKTCGECKHTDNELGFFALHCDILREKQIALDSGSGIPDGKVRSWERCHFAPVRFIARTKDVKCALCGKNLAKTEDIAFSRSKLFCRVCFRKAKLEDKKQYKKHHLKKKK